MAKALKPLMIVAAVAVMLIPGGQLISLGITAAMQTAIIGAGISAALGMAAGALGLGPKAPKVSPTNYDRLVANADPTTPRKIVFGETAMGVDIRHQEWSHAGDNDQGRLHRVFFHASHAVESIDEIWFEDRLAWSKTGGTQAFYKDTVGPHTGDYVTVATREVGTPANVISINGGGKWGASMRCTGLAYSYLQFLMVGTNPKEPTKSPFSSGVPGRMTVKGKGAKVYDPRLDSTVGGSGSHRANDQSTWEYHNAIAGDIGRNPALQILWYLLGWRIANPADGTMKLALGRGIPPSRIDMASFIAAANACDETVTSSINGTEPRYRSDGMFSENDDPNMVLDTLKSACNGDVRDTGGILSLNIRKNDLAVVSVQLTEADILGSFTWKQTPDLDETFNEVRGRYVDPSNNSLFQMRDYPAVRVEPPDGIERSDPMDLATVQSVSQAQRLAKTRLARNLYRGTFTADFNARAWVTGVGKIVELSVQPLGWSAKKFRVLEIGIRVDGVVPMMLQEENAAVYAWDNSDVAPVAAFTPTSYDPALQPIRQLMDSIEIGATRNLWTGTWAGGVAYKAGDLIIVNGVVYQAVDDHTSVGGAAPPNAHWTQWFATAGTSISATITKPAATLSATYDGIVTDYSSATGTWQVMAGTTDVTSQFLPITTVANPVTLDTSYVGASYAVTGSFDAGADTADLTMRLTGTGSFAGITFDRTFTLTKIRATIASDATPPAVPTGLALSSTVTQLPDGGSQAKLTATWTANSESDLAYYIVSVRQSGGNYVDFLVNGNRWDGPAIAGVTYEVQVAAEDTTGNTSAKCTMASLAVAGDTTAPGAPTGLTATAAYQTIFLSWTNPTATDLARVEVWENTSNNSGTATRIATVNAQSGAAGGFARSGLATGAARFYWLKAVDYSGNTSGFTASATATTGQVPGTDISGQLLDAQIAGLAASKVTGQLTDAQLAGISAAKLTGLITSTQITDGAISTPKLAAGAVTAAKITADTITSNEIAALAITSAELAAGAVVAGKIAAGTIQAVDIAAGAIVASKLTIGSASNVVPDDFQDLAWWTTGSTPPPSGTFLEDTNNSVWSFARSLHITNPGGNLDFFSRFFPVEPGATYKIVVSAWASADFNGWFKPFIHMPNWQWFSLKTGNAGTPDVNDADAFTGTGILANDLTFTVTNATGISNNANKEWQFRFDGSWTVGYVTFMCRIVRVSDTTLIKDGAITTAKITVGSLNADRILSGTITGGMFNTATSLPGTITVGATGVQIGTIQSQANDPIARANVLSTKITPGLVLISGATTLANWRNGGDNTKIEGGSIAANTITANKLTVGNRGITIWGLEFQYAGGVLQWQQGYVFWTDDNGGEQATLVAAGSATYTPNIYVYWVKGASTLSYGTDWGNIRSGSNNVVFCTWFGGTSFVANYGGTIINGDHITSGTITASKMATGYLEASWATISVLRTATSGARLEIDTTQLRVYDANRLRVRLGVWP